MIMLLISPERVRVILPKSLFVTDDVRMAQRSQDPNFVKRVLLLLFIEGNELDAL